jgi:hypothetical protein
MITSNVRAAHMHSLLIKIRQVSTVPVRLLDVHANYLLNDDKSASVNDQKGVRGLHG